MSSQKGSEMRTLYHFHLNKETGEVTGEELQYKKETDCLRRGILYDTYKFKIKGNSIKMYQWEIGRISDNGVYIVTFDDDLEAAADKFKKYWRKKAQGQHDKIQKEQLRYDEMKALYEKIC